MRTGLFADLQNGACAPKCALCGGGCDGGRFTHGEAITFRTEGVATIGTCQNDVTGAAFALHDGESARKEFGIVCGEAFGHGEESAVAHHNAAGGMEIATRALPRSEFGHDEGAGIVDRRGGLCADGHKQCHKGQRPKLNTLVKVHDVWILRI